MEICLSTTVVGNRMRGPEASTAVKAGKRSRLVVMAIGTNARQVGGAAREIGCGR